MKPVRVYCGSSPVSGVFFGGEESWRPESSVVFLAAHAEGEGSVGGQGLYRSGSEARLVATPSAGWTFDGWSDGIKSPSRVITARRDVFLTAAFSPIKEGTLYYDENY